MILGAGALPRNEGVCVGAQCQEGNVWSILGPRLPQVEHFCVGSDTASTLPSTDGGEEGRPSRDAPGDGHSVVPFLVLQMREGAETARVKAARALCSFACYDPANCLTILRGGGLTSIQAGLHGSDTLQLVAVLLLSNLATNVECKKDILRDALTPLVTLLMAGGFDARKAALAALSNIARLDAEASWAVVGSGALPWVILGLEAESLEEAALAALVLRSIVSTDAANSAAAVSAGAVEPLLHLLDGPCADAKLHSMWALVACVVHQHIDAGAVFPALCTFSAASSELGAEAGAALNIIARELI